MSSLTDRDPGKPRSVTARTTLRSEAESAGAARRFVADVLAQHGFPLPRIEDAMLLTSEAVGHAMRLGGTSIGLSVVADPLMGRVELVVEGEPGAGGDPDAPRPAGASLVLIQALAEEWGVERMPSGGCIWFEVRA